MLNCTSRLFLFHSMYSSGADDWISDGVLEISPISGLHVPSLPTSTLPIVPIGIPPIPPIPSTHPIHPADRFLPIQLIRIPPIVPIVTVPIPCIRILALAHLARSGRRQQLKCSLETYSWKYLISIDRMSLSCPREGRGSGTTLRMSTENAGVSFP